MFEIYLKDPGKIFVKNNGKVVRTPIKFYINESEKNVYETIIRASSIDNYSITSVDKDSIEVKTKKSAKLSQIKPKLGLDLNLKIQG